MPAFGYWNGTQWVTLASQDWVTAQLEAFKAWVDAEIARLDQQGRMAAEQAARRTKDK